MNYHKIITIEAGKRGGRPCVRKMRIEVVNVLGWIEDPIRACLAFAVDRERRVMTAA